MNNHYDLLAHMNALVQSGDNKTPLYYVLREAARKANMGGVQMNSLARAKQVLPAWAYAAVAARLAETEAAPLAA